MKFHAPVPASLRLAGALVAAWAAAAAAVPVIPLDEIRPGMTGYGLTVFEGARVDTFAVKVVGVQRNVRTAGSMILVEVSGHGLESARIVQGMSGSPVFLDGRLAGALASGWSGSLRAIGGVTPAGEMLRVSTEPPPAAAGASSPAAPPDVRALAGAAGEDLARALDWPIAAPAPASPGLPDGWPAPDALAQALLGPALATDLAGTGWVCVPAGAPAPVLPDATAAPTTLVPGAACAVPLVTGDAQLGAIGTVTWVDGDDVWMMGHPFMQRGPVRLPLASATVFTVLPSRQMSFKLGAIGPIVGAVHQDRRPALSGRLGAEAPLLPVDVRVDDARGRRDYRFAVADDPLLAPMLVFWTAYNALLAEGDDASLQTVRWTLDVDWRRAGSDAGPRTLRLDGAGAGPGGAAGLGRSLLAPLNLLLQNPFAPVRLTAVRVAMAVEPGLDTATVRGLDAPRRVPTGSAVLPLTVEIAPRRGETRRERIDLPLPAGLEPGRHRLVVASAAEFFGLEAQRAAARFEVADLEAALDLLETERGAGTLTAALLVPGRGAVVRGRELASLPGSLRATLRRAAGREGGTLADFVARLDRPTPWLLDGHAVLDLDVIDPDAPLEPERRP